MALDAACRTALASCADAGLAVITAIVITANAATRTPSFRIQPPNASLPISPAPVLERSMRNQYRTEMSVISSSAMADCGAKSSTSIDARSNASPVSQWRTVYANRFAYEGNGRSAEAQESVVKILPGRASSPRRGPVLAKLADHQLAQRVIQICGVVGATCGLLARRSRIGERLLAEERLALRDRQGPRVQPDRREEARIAKERVQQLADVDFRVAVAESRLPHQFLDVVRPSFGKGVSDKNTPDRGCHPIGMLERQEVAGPDLVKRREQEIGGAGNIRL